MASSPKPKPVPFYLGGMASCVAAMCTHPLDLIKVRMQTTKAAAAGTAATTTAAAPRGAIATGIAVVRQEGFFKLYAGLSGEREREQQQGERGARHPGSPPQHADVGRWW